MPPPDTRPLTAQEYRLTRWMLEHGGPQAQAFLPQLEAACATSWRCRCGCASWEFHVDASRPGAAPLTDCPAGNICDFAFDCGEDTGDVCGILLTQDQSVLRDVELYSSGDAPKSLPEPETLRPFKAG